MAGLNYNDEVSKWFYNHFSGITKIEYTDKNEAILYGNNIILTDYKLDSILYKIKEVHGNFLIGGDKFSRIERSHTNALTTLINCPDTVYGKFYCGLCPNLTSLEGGPFVVHGSYACNNTNIASLNGIAAIVEGNIMAYANKNLINIEALSNTQFNMIDLDLCVDFIYGAPIYRKLLAEHKVTQTTSLADSLTDLYAQQYKDVNQL